MSSYMVTFDRIVRERYVVEVEADTRMGAISAVTRNTSRTNDVYVPPGATHLNTIRHAEIIAADHLPGIDDDADPDEGDEFEEIYGDVPGLDWLGFRRESFKASA